VLLPGLDGTGTLFERLIPAFAQTFNIQVATYPPNRFLSYAELLPYLNEITPADPFVLVAESFSSPLAVEFAGRHPVNLVGLIMCAGFVTNPMGRWSYGVRALANPWLLGVPLPDFLLENFLIGRSAPVALKDAVRHALSLVHPNVLARRIHAVLDCDARESLRRIRVPIMYVQGGNDRLLRAKCFQEVRRLRPDIILVSIPAPHLILQREPQKAAGAIAKFADGLSDQSQPSLG
jgi:pimeloyl-[acyl-carrier protein] methyl ester esterase